MEKEVRDEGERRSWNKGGQSRPERSGTGYDRCINISPHGFNRANMYDHIPLCCTSAPDPYLL